MNRLIRSEQLKLRTIRLPLIALAIAALTGALSAVALITTAGHGDTPPLDRHSLLELVHAPFSIVVGAAVLLGILATAGELRHRTITSTLLVSPRRGQVITAKMLVHAAFGAILATVACAVTLAISIPWLASEHVALAAAGDVTAVFAGSVVAAALFAAAGTGLGALIANQTAAVAVALIWLLAVEGLIVSITSTPAIHDRLPGGAAGIVAAGGTGRDGAAGLLIAGALLTAYSGVLVVAGRRRLVTADVS